MFGYLEQLTAKTDLAFPATLLKPMYDLYLDLTSIYLTDQPNQRLPNSSLNYN